MCGTFWQRCLARCASLLIEVVVRKVRGVATWSPGLLVVHCMHHLTYMLLHMLSCIVYKWPPAVGMDQAWHHALHLSV